jgi:hypothetical protein
MMFLTSMELTPDTGIETNINRFYGEFSTVPRWNMCYASAKYMRSSPMAKIGTTLIEYMMLGAFTNVPSISGNFS